MNIYVGNLAYTSTEDDIRDTFAEYGPVSKVTIIKDRESGRSKGFGFVEMENDSDGENAIKELDGNDFKGRNLRVNQARPREERPRTY